MYVMNDICTHARAHHAHAQACAVAYFPKCDGKILSEYTKWTAESGTSFVGHKS